MIIPTVNKTSTPYSGKLITVRVDELSRDGGKSFVREVAVVSDSVAIVAVDSQSRVLMIRQYRHPMKRPVWEIPAGRIDTRGETTEQTALRELREETDIVAQQIQPITTFYNSGGWTTEKTHIFLARDLENVPEFARHDEEADIEKIWLPLPEALNMITKGEIDDAKTIVGILLVNQRIAQNT